MAHEQPGHNRIAKHLAFGPIEDSREKALRLHKERIGFYAKDLAPWLILEFLVLGIGFICFWNLVRAGSSPEEKARAWGALTTILCGIVGFLFGKAAR
jgi:hypothetical protein